MSEPSSLPLRFWYAALAVIGTVAALQAIVWPRWPRVAPLRPTAIETALRQAGWPVKLSTKLAARRGYEISSSPLLSARLPDGGERLSLVAAAVRQRDSFQLAFISRDLPGLSLRKRQLPEDTPASASGELRGGLARQSCLLPGLPGDAGFAVSKDGLTAAADRLSAEAGRRGQLLRLAGLAAHRSTACVLISLESAPDQPPPSQHRWQRLLKVLQPALQPASTQPQRPGRAVQSRPLSVLHLPDRHQR